MAVGKRLRYEVLRRDNHTCRYCGAAAPDVKLTVDHVVPTTLGGADEASNLVAACQDCNAGKSSSTADASLIEDVDQDAVRWARARERAAAMATQQHETQQVYIGSVLAVWEGYHYASTGKPIPLPDDAELSLANFFRYGLPLRIAEDFVSETMQTPGVRDEWRYFCAKCWRKIEEIQDAARSLVETDETEWPS